MTKLSDGKKAAQISANWDDVFVTLVEVMTTRDADCELFIDPYNHDKIMLENARMHYHENLDQYEYASHMGRGFNSSKI